MNLFKISALAVVLMLSSFRTFAKADDGKQAQARPMQILIDGSTASDLFDDVAVREGVISKPCFSGESVTLGATYCMRDAGGETQCILNYYPGEMYYTLPEVCKGPESSIIGVGSTPPGIVKKPAIDTKPSNL